MKEQITNYIRAGYSGIYILSCEEARVEFELKAIASTLDYRLFAWSVTEGLLDTADGSSYQASDPLDLFDRIEELPENALFLLRDYHQFFEDASPLITRRLKETLRLGKTRGKVVIILGCRQVLPPELERELVRVEFSLPEKEELRDIMLAVARSAKLESPAEFEEERLLNAATGLTSIEAENAFALSVVESRQLSAEIVAREKAREVKKNGLLEVYSVPVSLDDIGGLNLLKDWLIQRIDAFSIEAEEYGLPSPKGLLIIGIPGTGKSLTAKATAHVLGRPLLKLDAGRLFGGLVGQSEANLRSVIATVEAIAPCALWLDEVEKGFSGSKASNFTDGGTSSRVFGSFLSWMQEKSKPVFVVATANDVTQLPPEFLRKGRFDELFFIDLPNEKEREAIWKIQIRKYGREPEGYDVSQLARATKGFTGAEIEQAFIDALYDGFAKRSEPSDLTIAMLLESVVPLSRLMSESISALRQWSKGRARLATSQEEPKMGRRILPN